MILNMKKEVFCKVYTYFHMKTSVLFDFEPDFYVPINWSIFRNMYIRDINKIINSVRIKDDEYEITESFCNFDEKFLIELDSNMFLDFVYKSFTEILDNNIKGIGIDTIELSRHFVYNSIEDIYIAMEKLFKVSLDELSEGCPEYAKKYHYPNFYKFISDIFMKKIMSIYGFDIDDENLVFWISKYEKKYESKILNQNSGNKVLKVKGLMNVINELEDRKNDLIESGIKNQHYIFMKGE